MNGTPGGEDGDHAEKRREHYEQEADTVDAKMIFGANGGDPIGGFLEGERLIPRIPPMKQRKRDQEAEDAKEIAGDLVPLLVLARNKQQQQSAHERSKQDHAQDMTRKKVHSHRLSAHAAQKNLHVVPVIRQKND